MGIEERQYTGCTVNLCHNPTCQLQGRLGKRAAATCQMMNFVGFLPVALYIAGGALQVQYGWMARAPRRITKVN